MEKVFLLGVGAQKSGTTWLHSYLSGHPQANMGAAKEYHVFDALHVADEGIRRKFLQRRINQLLQGVERLKPIDRLVAGFLGDTQRYYDYFTALLEQDAINVTGDITPSYSALPVSALIEIRDEFARRGIRVRVILLMRDPVERCISAVQHVLRQPGESYTGRCHFGGDGETVLRELYASPAFVMRGRYDQTLERLEQVFDPEDIGLFFYETLFKEATTKQVCNFLGLSLMPAKYELRVNASSNEITVGQALRSEVQRFYRPVYERFAAQVEGLWQGCPAPSEQVERQ
ncbi:sulfotransferase [Ectopseudomonas hydrolytica]|uniref:Sulfotransferase n=1 Tax=Ectopseudomonas hydrolytica TaxID=2493633 RepID=A0ABY5ACA2_9GAMM|nr:sulfotransferase domain-containing protein [Pseudomonas hydrolytica]USR41529.1 sulfotransferase [Pseudomonas hydrolytica]